MGCMNIVIFLIQNQASPDEATVRGETPLHLAARANQTDIIRILLRNGAKVDARARVSVFYIASPKYGPLGGSSGLVVMGEDSRSGGREFESLHHILDGIFQFSH